MNYKRDFLQKKVEKNQVIGFLLDIVMQLVNTNGLADEGVLILGSSKLCGLSSVTYSTEFIKMWNQITLM